MTRSGASSSAPTRIRRTLLRRERRHLAGGIGRVLSSPVIGWGALIAACFIAACGMLANWARERPMIGVGQVAQETRMVRVEFTTLDPETTETRRSEARNQADRVYVADDALLDEVRRSISQLPVTLSAVEDLDAIAPPLREAFKPTPESLSEIRTFAIEGEPSGAWVSAVDRLLTLLSARPILDEQTWQVESQASNKWIQLIRGEQRRRAATSSAINMGNVEDYAGAVASMVREAGFPPTLAVLVSNRLLHEPKPTFRFDPALTQTGQNEAAANVSPAIKKHPRGEIIYTRGEPVSAASVELDRAERLRFRDVERDRVWLRRASVFGAVAAITFAAGGYAALFCTRLRQNAWRLAAIAGLMAGALCVSVLGAAAAPMSLTLASTAPTVFIAAILVIAYDQRVSLALSSLHGILTCIALDQPIGMYALIITGVGMVVWQLREVRDRHGLIRMSALTALSLSVGTILVTLIDRPISPEALRQLLPDAGFAGFGGLLVGGVTLFVLPVIERLFDITTGMTLIELRDPKHPLLRMLQQRAPGTYNHSLNVASLAEAAADTIGADALLTYVGALYHDCGKANKPEYFVENISGGKSKHEKLSPAMSLLVIVGHVKDGMELAREFGLPRPLHHFIEAHHGTTLVEFFYNRARQQAQAAAASDPDAPDMPEEIEYRYPGPRPRTREVAIVMLSDAVESATRSMSEPTPGRIEALVRAIANARLMDGQFDDCDLTLRELQRIVESITKTLTAIYHGRVQYPSTAGFSKQMRA